MDRLNKLQDRILYINLALPTSLICQAQQHQTVPTYLKLTATIQQNNQMTTAGIYQHSKDHELHNFINLPSKNVEKNEQDNNTTMFKSLGKFPAKIRTSETSLHSKAQKRCVHYPHFDTAVLVELTECTQGNFPAKSSSDLPSTYANTGVFADIGACRVVKYLCKLCFERICRSTNLLVASAHVAAPVA